MTQENKTKYSSQSFFDIITIQIGNFIHFFLFSMYILRFGFWFSFIYGRIEGFYQNPFYAISKNQCKLCTHSKEGTVPRKRLSRCPLVSVDAKQKFHKKNIWAVLEDRLQTVNNLRSCFCQSENWQFFRQKIDFSLFFHSNIKKDIFCQCKALFTWFNFN